MVVPVCFMPIQIIISAWPYEPFPREGWSNVEWKPGPSSHHWKSYLFKL